MRAARAPVARSPPGEVVRRLVQHQRVHAAGGEERDRGAAALSRRERSAGAEDVVRSEGERREQGTRLTLCEAAVGGEAVEQPLVARKRARSLRQLAEHRSRSQTALAGAQGKLAEQRLQHGGLAGAVPAEDREPVAVAELDVDRADPKRAAL